jgi:beta-glucosidase-like glycosyl hydrolase/CubicO group peptidase (beta-lactamase class C family)
MNGKLKYYSAVILIVLSISALFLLYAGGVNSLSDDDARFNKNTSEIFLIDNDAWVEKTIANMSIEEKIGQLIFPAVYGKSFEEGSSEYNRLKHLINDLNVGGFILMNTGFKEQIDLTNKLQSLAKYPLLFSADYERGIPEVLSFPYNMGIGAANDEWLTFKMGEIVAKIGRAVGVHQNYSPVIDINNNPMNPIINVRSFGESSANVTKLSNSYIKGLQKWRMLATSKHFPGHGNTSIDSHKDIPILNITKKSLYKLELQPFKSNIQNGVMSVMVGHLGLPKIESEQNLSSSLSKIIVTDILRSEIKFNGLIVTDAMNMEAITKYHSPSEAAKLAFIAGNDAILFPPNEDEAFYGILNAVKIGEISETRLNESVRRILLAKRWLGIDRNRFIDSTTTLESLITKEYRKIANQLAQKSITLVKNDQNLIPINSDSSKRYFHIALLENHNSHSAEKFNSYLSSRIKNSISQILPIKSTKREYEEVINKAKHSNVIILSVYLKMRASKGTIGLSESQEDLINSIISLNKPIILLSHGNPYLLMAFQKIKTYLTNYGDSPISELAFAQALFGENDIEGMLPVSIPNTPYKYGHSIKICRTKLCYNDNFQTDVFQKQFENVESLILNAIKDSIFSGASLLIAKDGEILFEKAFGRFTYDPNSNSILPNTIFDLASVTKVTATTTAAMICIDKKYFSLDDKVCKYLPPFSAKGKENITIRNLLLHNSGLISFKPFYKLCKNAKEVFKEICNSELDYQTGTKTVYSDLGMITLGKVIEKVTKKSLDKFCKDEIFNPLAMKDTYFKPPTELKNRIAPTEVDNYWRHRLLWGEVHDENSYMLGGVAGHAGLFSTANDLAVLLQMILQKGFYKGKQYIQKETVELFTKKQSDQSSRALGWDTKSESSSCGKLFSEFYYGHTGFTGTSVWTDPLKNLIVIFLTNRVHPTRDNNKLGKFRPVIHSAIYHTIE